MPELPEVETTRRGLERVLDGAIIKTVDVRRRDLRWPIPADLETRLCGHKVSRLTRRAKYILVELDDDSVWMIHLGMSGRIIVEKAGSNEVSKRDEPHVHVVLETEAGDTMLYQDIRRFGSMDWITGADLATHPRLTSLGIEPLAGELSGPWLSNRLTGKAAPLKAALLDQRIIAGLGNIYVCEALNRAKVSPFRAAGSLTKPEAKRLAAEIQQTLAEAIEAGGSSLRDYVQTDGELGYFQHAWRVYGREGEPCQCQKQGVIERSVQSGRSTFYCPACQA
jgi:formamidopyrimidine-DNA glycosylase